MGNIRYATLCSGIGCAELAADSLCWEPTFQSEIDVFACAVLKDRFPLTPNLGDMTTLAGRIRNGDVADELIPDVLVAGTPCQSFSIAGSGGSLDDPRGRITLELVNVLDAIDERRFMEGKEQCTLVWENVPNVLSKDDNPLGCLLAALVGANRAIRPYGRRGRWPRAGVVSGPRRSACWRIFDAQYFGVAQRRRRLFLVAGAGKGFDPSAVLLESDGVRRDNPPSRETAKDVTGTISARANAGGKKRASDGLGTDFDCDGGLVPVVSYTLSAARGAAGAGDVQETYIPVSVIPIIADADRSSSSAITPCPDAEGRVRLRDPGIGIGDDGDPMFTLQSTRPHAVAYGGNNQSGPIVVATARSAHGGPHGRLDFETETFLVTGGDVVHALNTANNGKHCSEDGTGRGVPIIAFDSRQDTIHSVDYFGSLSSSSPQSQSIATSMQVRRLTVTECERLQGLPDGYTFIRDARTRKKLENDYYEYLVRNFPNLSRSEAEIMAKDGPRYRTIGNGMAVPVVRWILERLEKHMKGEL
jgi:DNA (cytosine-5)-methyltransferase 1